MQKVVTFREQDESLIKKIEQYQKKNKFPSFIAAVRELCKNALAFNELVKK